MKPIHKQKNSIEVLSLGCGVQSTALALCYANRRLSPPPDFAVFADTQREPPSVYKTLEELKKIVPFKIIVASKGDLGNAPNKIPFFFEKPKNGKA